MGFLQISLTHLSLGSSVNLFFLLLGKACISYALNESAEDYFFLLKNIKIPSILGKNPHKSTSFSGSE